MTGELMPVIFVGVLGFNLFKNNNDYLTIHHTLNVKTHERNLQLMEFCYIELRKFTKTIDQLDTVVDKWIYLLQNASKFDQIPEQLQKPAALEEAMATLNQSSLSLKELALYDKYLDARCVEKSVIETAEERGEAKGEAKGRAKGIAEGEARGKAKGKAEGKAEAQRAIAKQLLASGMAATEVAKVTGLFVDEIEKLKD